MIEFRQKHCFELVFGSNYHCKIMIDFRQKHCFEIDGFNKKSGSYILECSNIEHKEETIQARSHDFRNKLEKLRVHALKEYIL